MIGQRKFIVNTAAGGTRQRDNKRLETHYRACCIRQLYCHYANELWVQQQKLSPAGMRQWWLHLWRQPRENISSHVLGSRWRFDRRVSITVATWKTDTACTVTQCHTCSHSKLSHADTCTMSRVNHANTVTERQAQWYSQSRTTTEQQAICSNRVSNKQPTNHTLQYKC